MEEVGRGEILVVLKGFHVISEQASEALLCIVTFIFIHLFIYLFFGKLYFFSFF